MDESGELQLIGVCGDAGSPTASDPTTLEAPGGFKFVPSIPGGIDLVDPAALGVRKDGAAVVANEDEGVTRTSPVTVASSSSHSLMENVSQVMWSLAAVSLQF